MTCEKYKTVVQDYADGRLSTSAGSAIEHHIRSCDSCTTYYQEILKIKSLLRQLPRPKAPNELQQKILQQRQSIFGKRRINFYKNFLSAAAAVLALVFVVNLFWVIEQKVNVQQSTVIANLNQPHQVNFLVHAEHAMEDVTFLLTVPPEIELYGYSGQQTLSWQGKLKQGNNLLSVPVMALKLHAGILTMKIKHQNNIKEYKVVVDVQKDKVTQSIKKNTDYS